MSKQFAVIGLGLVGRSLAATLDYLGHDVLGIDRDGDLIQDLSDELPNANLVTADVTDDNVLRDLGLDQFDGAAVTIGEEHVEANMLVTLILKEIGVPMVISRATSPLHGRVLERIGADNVVQPEKEFGQFLARQMASPGMKDYLQLGNDEAVIEIEVPKEWVDKNLSDMKIHRKMNLTFLAIKVVDKDCNIP